jgi:hypothetical protein
LCDHEARETWAGHLPEITLRAGVIHKFALKPFEVLTLDATSRH